jgi:4-aminobutyrate aminotransferase-like enzyme
MIGVEFVVKKECRAPYGAFTDALVTEAYERGLLLLSCSHSTIRIGAWAYFWC